MSNDETERNRWLVQRSYQLIGAGDLDSLLALYDRSATWLIPGTRPWSGTYVGHEEIREFFARLSGDLEILSFKPREIFVEGYRAVVLGVSEARVRALGTIYRTDWAHVLAVVGGRIVSLQDYHDTAAVQAATR